MSQLPAFLFIFNLIFEAGWRSSNALWTKSFYQTIKVNLSVFFVETSNLSNVYFQKTDSLLLPLITRSRKEFFFFYFCSRSILMNIRHIGACSKRFLNARSELYPLKQQYSLIY